MIIGSGLGNICIACVTFAGHSLLLHPRAHTHKMKCRYNNTISLSCPVRLYACVENIKFNAQKNKELSTAKKKTGLVIGPMALKMHTSTISQE